jgi:hypothetical protein
MGEQQSPDTRLLLSLKTRAKERYLLLLLSFCLLAPFPCHADGAGHPWTQQMIPALRVGCQQAFNSAMSYSGGSARLRAHANSCRHILEELQPTPTRATLGGS